MKTVNCQNCSQPFSVKPYREKAAKYCSLECRNIAYIGKEPPNKGKVLNQVSLICPECKKPFTRITSRLKHGRGKYCSPECQYAAIKERPKQGEVYPCLNCGKNFILSPSRTVKKGAGKYCSRACRDIHRIGENHPQYLNGRAQEKRGANWQAQKRKTKRRDKWTCQHCGMKHAQSMEEFSQPLAVHHIRPYREFSTYLEANELSNLITLCHRCHRVADAELQRAERNV